MHFPKNCPIFRRFFCKNHWIKYLGTVCCKNPTAWRLSARPDGATHPHHFVGGPRNHEVTGNKQGRPDLRVGGNVTTRLLERVHVLLNCEFFFFVQQHHYHGSSGCNNMEIIKAEIRPKWSTNESINRSAVPVWCRRQTVSIFLKKNIKNWRCSTNAQRIFWY